MSGQALHGTGEDDRRALGASFIMGEKGITQPEWSGVIVAVPLNPVNDDLVTRLLAARQGCHTYRHASLSWSDRCVNAPPRYTPCPKPIAAALVCLTDSSGSQLDTVDLTSP